MRYSLTMDQLQDAFSVLDSSQPTILCRPTGTGKTVVACYLIDLWRSQGKNVLFVVERRALVEQASDKLREAGVPHGVIMAGQPHYPAEPVQVVSRDTLHMRGIKGQRMELPPCDVYIRDEAHRGMGRVDRILMDRYGGAYRLGLTATPELAGGRAMAGVWKRLVYNLTMQRAIEMGSLVPNRFYVPTLFSDRELKVRDGEFVLNHSAEALVNNQVPVGDVVSSWLKYGEGRPTFVFAVSIRQSQAIAEAFCARGIKAVHVDLHTESTERDCLKADMAGGGIEVICSCELMGYGVDWPFVACCVHMRPTKSRATWVQFCGRGNRLYPGKSDAIQIDHVGNTYRLGAPEEISDWSLDGTPPKLAKPSARRSRPCPACGRLRISAGPCPGCGREPAKPEHETVDSQPGSIIPAKPSRRKRSPEQALWDQCLGVAIRRGATLRAAFAHFRSRSGRWPGRSLQKVPPAGCDLGMSALEWYNSMRGTGPVHDEARS